MDNVSIFLDPNSEHPDDKVEIGLEPAFNIYYTYAPWQEFNGTTDYFFARGTSDLDLDNFTVMAWFKTSKNYTPDGIRGFIVNKGDAISNGAAGTHLNYGIWIDSFANTITGGFETSDGTDKLVTSPLSYNDGKWHHVVLTYDHVTVKLYIDGVTTPVATLNSTTTPDTNTNRITVGRNSAAKNRYFEGQIDEVNIYDRAITATEVEDYYLNSNVPEGSVYSNGFGPGNYKYSPYFEATGSTYDSTASTEDLRLVSFTIVTWFRTIMTGWGLILMKGDDTAAKPGSSGTHVNYALYHETGGKIGIWFEDNEGTGSPTCESSTGYNDGQWHLAVATYDRGGQTLKLYMDGDLVKTTNDVTISPDSGTPGSDPLVIGRNSHNNWDFFDGQIDEVRLYNHHMWSDDDVNRYYDTGVLPDTDSLVFEKDFGDVDEPVPNYDTIVAQTIPSITTAPIGVTFSSAPTDAQGLQLGTLGAKQGKPFWLKRTLSPTTEELKHNSFTLVIAFDAPVIVPGTEPGAGSGSGTGGGGTTPTPGPPVSDVDMAVDGDWGTSSGTKATVSNILNFDSIKHTITTGDVSYEKTADKWKDITSGLRANGKKMYFVAGNHDYDDSSSLISAYKSIFGFSSTYASYTIGNVLLITGDMYKSFSSGSDQYKFIKSELEKAKNNSAILWKIVSHHEPLYGSPSKHDNNTKWRDLYHPLYDANGVDLDLNGHNHHYERLYPLKYNSQSPSSPTIIHKSDEPNFVNPGAPIFITCGLGGHDIQYAFKGSRKSWSAFGEDSYFGFLMLSISNNGRTLTGKLYKNSGHELMDTFTIKK